MIDKSEGKSVYNFFGNGIVPYNVVIDRNGKLIYSKSGFDKDEIINAIRNGLKVSKTEFCRLIYEFLIRNK